MGGVVCREMMFITPPQAAGTVEGQSQNPTNVGGLCTKESAMGTGEGSSAEDSSSFLGDFFLPSSSLAA
jgi:hypothetical protein